MRPRDERAHPVVKDAITKGHVGTGKHYVIGGFASKHAANEGRKSINNAARHLGVSCSSTEAADLQELTDGSWQVRFLLFPKNEGRRHIHSQAGGDPANLAYNPFARAEGAVVDANGGFTGRL
jgi:hypothetical protein